MQVTSICRRSVTPLLRDAVLHLSRTSSISTSASVSREPSVSRSVAMEPHRVMSLLFDDSVLNPISVGICTDRKAPIGSSKNVALISRLKVPAFDNCVPNNVMDLTLVKVAVSRHVTAFRKRSGVRKLAGDSCGDEGGLRRTRSGSCFVRIKWQKMTYNDVQVLPNDSPVQLKLLLEKLTGVPLKSQKLSCCGKVLKDDVPMYVAPFQSHLCRVTPCACVNRE